MIILDPTPILTIPALTKYVLHLWRSLICNIFKCGLCLQSDMIVDRIPLSIDLKLPSPFPEGDYRIDVAVEGNSLLRATFMLYASVKEDKI